MHDRHECTRINHDLCRRFYHGCGIICSILHGRRRLQGLLHLSLTAVRYGGASPGSCEGIASSPVSKTQQGRLSAHTQCKCPVLFSCIKALNLRRLGTSRARQVLFIEIMPEVDQDLYKLLEDALTPAENLWAHVRFPSLLPGTGVPVMCCTLDCACAQPSSAACTPQALHCCAHEEGTAEKRDCKYMGSTLP